MTLNVIDCKPMRKIKSFVRRSGRLTVGQKAGLEDLYDEYNVSLPQQGALDLDSLFAKSQPLVVEIGFGNGDSLLTMATNAPDKNFIGIEVYAAGIGRIINEAHKSNLNNLKIINADADEVLQQHIANNSIDILQIFFPDPWHKKKHHKRRLIQAKFLDVVTKKIKAGGKIHLATDWDNYAMQMMSELETHKNFKNTMDAHIYSLRPDYRPITKFEKRGIRLGHKSWDLIFINEK